MNEQWQELKETIIEMRDNNGALTQQEVCKFLANLMDVLEKQMSSSENEKDWLQTFNTDSATECYTAVQRLKESLNDRLDEGYKG